MLSTHKQSSTLNQSKYTSPVLPDIISRNRLFKKMEKNREKKVIFIFGQAAQGKSTLIASYLIKKGLKTGDVDKVLLGGVIGEMALIINGHNIGKKKEFLENHGYLKKIDEKCYNTDEHTISFLCKCLCRKSES